MEERGLSISFDLDGTLTDTSFVDAVWNEGIPREVARIRGLSLSDAKDMCAMEYAKVGELSIRWYKLDYWLGLFGLGSLDTDALILKFVDSIRLYEDAIPVLDECKKQGLKMVVFSNATRPFLDREVEATGLSQYIDTFISVPDDWGMIKADKKAFARLQTMFKTPFVHAGDHLYSDYEVPKSIGIEAYHIWRGSGPRLESSLYGLTGFMDRVLRAQKRT